MSLKLGIPTLALADESVAAASEPPSLGAFSDQFNDVVATLLSAHTPDSDPIGLGWIDGTGIGGAIGQHQIGPNGSSAGTATFAAGEVFANTVQTTQRVMNTGVEVPFDVNFPASSTGTRLQQFAVCDLAITVGLIARITNDGTNANAEIADLAGTPLVTGPPIAIPSFDTDTPVVFRFDDVVAEIDFLGTKVSVAHGQGPAATVFEQTKLLTNYLNLSNSSALFGNIDSQPVAISAAAPTVVSVDDAAPVVAQTIVATVTDAFVVQSMIFIDDSLNEYPATFTVQDVDTVDVIVPAGTVGLQLDLKMTTAQGSGTLADAVTVSSSWVPSDLGSKLVSWFDPDDVSSLTKDVSDEVSAWDDQAAVNTLSQAMVVDRPKYEAAQVNGKGTLRFDLANTEWMRSNAMSALNNATAVSLVFVFSDSPANTSGVFRAYLSSEWGASGDRSILSAQDNGAITTAGHHAGQWRNNLGTLVGFAIGNMFVSDLTVFHTIGFRARGNGDLQVYVQNGQLFNGFDPGTRYLQATINNATLGGGLGNHDHFDIGRTSFGTPGRFDMRAGPLVIANGAMDDDNEWDELWNYCQRWRGGTEI